MGEWISPQTHLPFVNKDGIIQAQPVAILDRRLIKRHGCTDAKVLVRWQGAGDEEATWEVYNELQSKFPELISRTRFFNEEAIDMG